MYRVRDYTARYVFIDNSNTYALHTQTVCMIYLIAFNFNCFRNDKVPFLDTQALHIT